MVRTKKETNFVIHMMNNEIHLLELKATLELS